MNVTVYISIYAVIILWLSLRVINRRRLHQISVGDGGVEDLKIAIATQSNAVEYLPITLLLLLALELNGANAWVIHLFGVIVIVGRVYHIIGMYSQRLNARVLGMRITLFSLMMLSILNLAHLAKLLYVNAT